MAEPRLLGALPVATEPLAGDGPAMVDLARQCEAAGFDGIVVSDHVVMATEPSGFPGGSLPFPSDAPFFEPLTLASAIAAVTSTIVIATGIVIVPLRPPLLFAKSAACLDRLSRGRLELGVGLGWQREEYDAMGIPWDDRGLRLTETIRACREVWTTGGPATFAGETISFANIWCRPAPHREGGPPILFAGNLSRRNAERILELGDGWLPMFGTRLDALERDVNALHRLAIQAGRTVSELRVRVDLGSTSRASRGDLAHAFDEAAQLLHIGVTDVVLRLGPLLATAARADEAVAEAGARWRAMANR